MRLVGKLVSTRETSVSISAATSPLIKFDRPLMIRQRSGYLTATTEWYVIGLTRELEGNMRPQVYEPLTPVWLLRSAWISPAIGRRVSACCNIQAGRISDRDKFTVVPSSSSE